MQLFINTSDKFVLWQVTTLHQNSDHHPGTGHNTQHQVSHHHSEIPIFPVLETEMCVEHVPGSQKVSALWAPVPGALYVLGLDVVLDIGRLGLVAAL